MTSGHPSRTLIHGFGLRMEIQTRRLLHICKWKIQRLNDQTVWTSTAVAGHTQKTFFFANRQRTGKRWWEFDGEIGAKWQNSFRNVPLIDGRYYYHFVITHSSNETAETYATTEKRKSPRVSRLPHPSSTILFNILKVIPNFFRYFLPLPTDLTER